MRAVSVVILLVVGVVVGIGVDRGFLSKGGGDSGGGGEQAEADGEGALGDPVNWKLASSYTLSLALVGPSVEAFIDNLSVASGDNMTLKFFEPGALVPPLEVFDAVSSGSVDAGYSTPGFWAGKEAALQLFSAVPFGPDAPEYLAWYYNGGGQPLLDEIYAKHNIKAHLCGLFAPEASGWFRNEIASSEDLSGLKMRFFGLGARVIEKLGVSTQLIAPGDIYPALELGTIDATELASPAIDKSLGFYQIAKHYYFPGWHQQSTWVELIVNLDRWNALTPRQQRLFEITCGNMVQRTIALGEAEQVPALEYFQEQGVTLHEWSPEILAELEAAWQTVVAEEVAKDETFKRAWESMNDFRTRYAVWRELGYLK